MAILFRVLLRLIVAVLALGLVWGAYLYVSAGQLKEIEELIPGDCLEVSGAPGAEDITVDRLWQVALVSSDPRNGEPGAIYSYPLRTDDAELSNLTPDLELYPHGISLWSPQGAGQGISVAQDSERSQPRLFVVNHPRDEDGKPTSSVEIFDWNGRQLSRFGDPITDDELFQLNDLVAVGPNAFYATRDHGSTSARSVLIEDLTKRKRGAVVYYDGDRASGERVRVVADGFAYPNGINVSPDGSQVYVASTTTGKIHILARDLDTGDLARIQDLDLGTGVDNIEVDRYGKLWIGAHPKLLSFMSHASDHSKLSPTEVLWVDPIQDLDPWLRRVYVERGEKLSGGSVAAPVGARIVVGSVFEPHFLICQYG